MAPSAPAHPMPAATPRRLARLPRRQLLGRRVPVASSFASRLLGLALLPRERAGEGLLLPRCRAVHTFGMRFPLDLAFLDARGRALRVELAVGPGRLLWERRADAVLELPSPALATDGDETDAALGGGEERSDAA